MVNKLSILSLIFSLLVIQAFAQVKFEKGYFIDNSGQRAECLIRNAGWKVTPSSFEYKLTENEEAQKKGITDVQEFGFHSSYRFIRANVSIDRSSKSIGMLYSSKDPVWSQEQLFLKVLVEGKANLFFYAGGNTEVFFFQLDDGKVQQLVYRKYELKANLVRENHFFRQQLWNELRCGNTSLSSLEKLNYNAKDLEGYFENYNECKGAPMVRYNIERKSKGAFHLKLTPGINHSSFSIANPLSKELIAFNNKWNVRIGLEGEYILPYNKNKWALTLEPSYHSFANEASYRNEIASVKLNAIEFPVGLRYYSFLRDDLRLFYNASLIPGFTYTHDSYIKLKSDSRGGNIQQGWNFSLGVGVSYKSLSTEIRYHTKRELLGEQLFWTTNYNRVSFIVGYRLF